MLKYVITILLIFVTSSSAVVYASKLDVLTTEQSLAMQTALSVNGYITKNIYDQFWYGIPKTAKIEMLKRFKNESFFLLASQIQKENARTALLSLEANEIVVTNNLRSLWQKAENSGMDIKIGKENLYKMIKAALNKEPIEINGMQLYVTKELLMDMEENIDSSIERAKMLFQPTWKETQKERKIGKAKIIWSRPFNHTRETNEGNNGLVLKSNVYTATMNEYDLISISEILNLSLDPKECATSMIPDEVIPIVSKNTIQGHVSYDFNYIMKLEGKNYYSQGLCVTSAGNTYILLVGSNQEGNAIKMFSDARRLLMLP